jgi:KaiC/GvpD/RAD55 family RecA-like ATPase
LGRERFVADGRGYAFQGRRRPADVSDPSPVSSGDATLDGALGGGFPERRTVLVTGGPGTGKTTLGVQFLQAGLDAGEDCLFVSTEQTHEELRESLSGFSFDVDHEALSFLTVHATPGRVIESEEPQLTIQSLEQEREREGPFDETFALPFTSENLIDRLAPHGPVDRVVFDSVSGLSVMADGHQRFRRTVLDLVRFLTDEFGATTLFTAEAAGEGGEAVGADLLRYATHGVVELRRERVEDDPHRFLEVTKLRGVEHDRRTFELELASDGVRVGPARRSQPPALKDHRHAPVGVEGLDRLCGGGLIRGAGVLLQHDGRATLAALFGALLDHALSGEETTVLVPTMSLRESRTASLLEGHGHDVEALLADGRLAVVDLVGGWDASRPNVAAPAADAESVLAALADATTAGDGGGGDGAGSAGNATRGGSTFSLVAADAVVHSLGPSGAREVRYGVEADLLDPEDGLVDVVNPHTVPDRVTGFYHDVAEQVLDTWVEDSGLQYVSLRKSPCGFVGSTSLVEYVEESPYLRVQDPPRSRENPYAGTP